MSKHGLKVKILQSNVDPDASEVLQSAWIKIYGLPPIALVEEVIMKAATLIGEPIVVDELSLIKLGLVRVKVNCIDPLKLRRFVRIFFNKVGYPIRFVSEKYKDKTTLPPPPPPDKDDDEGDDMEEEDNFDDEDGDRKHKRRAGIAKGADSQVSGFCSGKTSSSKVQGGNNMDTEEEGTLKSVRRSCCQRTQILPLNLKMV
jgi:hypothetical protein